MGQRLNIEIKRKEDNKVLANCYYHWSGYTKTALELASEIINNVDDIICERNKASDTIKAIQLLQTTGAGVEEEDYDELEETDQKYCNVGIDRNLGLIAFTEDCMNQTRYYEEGRLTITIDFKDNNFHIDKRQASVDFEVYWLFDEEMQKDYQEEIESGEIVLENAVKFDFDIHNMKLVDIYDFLRKYEEVENSSGLFKDKSNNIYKMIY